MNSYDINVGTKYKFRKSDGTVIEAICTYKEERDGIITADFGRFAYCSKLSYKMEFCYQYKDYKTYGSNMIWTDWKDINES